MNTDEILDKVISKKAGFCWHEFELHEDKNDRYAWWYECKHCGFRPEVLETYLQNRKSFLSIEGMYAKVIPCQSCDGEGGYDVPPASDGFPGASEPCTCYNGRVSLIDVILKHEEFFAIDYKQYIKNPRLIVLDWLEWCLQGQCLECEGGRLIVYKEYPIRQISCESCADTGQGYYKLIMGLKNDTEGA